MYVSTSCLRGNGSRYAPNVFEVLEAYKRLGIRKVELGTAHRYVNGINRLCGCKDFDFIVHSLFPPVKENFMMNFASATGIRDRSIRAAKAAIEFCRRIDAPLYSAHAGFLADIDDLGNPLSQSIAREAAEERIVSALRELCDFAESHRIKVAIENSTGSGPHLLFFSAEQYLSILKEVNSKSLGLLIDLGHLAISSSYHKVDPRRFTEQLSDHILEFHVHETIDGVDHRPLIDSGILSRFGIGGNLVRRAFFTLEANGLDEEEVSQSAALLSKAIRQAKTCS